jgi:hypothetical protein
MISACVRGAKLVIFFTVYVDFSLSATEIEHLRTTRTQYFLQRRVKYAL